MDRGEGGNGKLDFPEQNGPVISGLIKALAEYQANPEFAYPFIQQESSFLLFQRHKCRSTGCLVFVLLPGPTGTGFQQFSTETIGQFICNMGGDTGCLGKEIPGFFTGIKIRTSPRVDWGMRYNPYGLRFLLLLLLVRDKARKRYFVYFIYPCCSMPSINVKESLCVRLLRFLNEKQRRGFESYLNCTLFNTNASLVKVFEVLLRRAMEDPSIPLNPENLFAETGLNPGLFPKYATQLVAQLERFVPVWVQKNDPRHGFADAFAFWDGVGLDQNLIERQYRKMKRKAGKLPPSEWQLFQTFELEHRYLQYKAGHPRKDQASLFESAESSFEQLYQVFRIRYHCARQTLERVFPLDENDVAIDFTKIDPDKLPLLGQAYYRAALHLEEQDLSLGTARDFFQWLREKQCHFSREDREDLFGFLLNICIRNANQNGEFQPLLNEVYMEMVEGDLLNNRSQFPGSHFKNLVSIKIKLGELGAASQFIEQYQQDLGEGDRMILVPYTRGLVAYHRGDFREAVKEYRRVLDGQPVDIFWGLETRLMLWRSYYEILDSMDQEEHEEFLRQYDCLRIYLSRRGHLTPEQKVGFEHFIRIFNRLAGLKEGLSSRKELEELRGEVLELPVIRQRSWLCQIIDRQLAAMHD